MIKQDRLSIVFLLGHPVAPPPLHAEILTWLSCLSCGLGFTVYTASGADTGGGVPSHPPDKSYVYPFFKIFDYYI